MTEPKLTRRLSDLEERTAHQEKTIEELNEMVSEQWRTIDGLEERLLRLQDRLQALESSGPAQKPEDEPPPPHY
ncbi:MAG TPA: SlyX protein [Rhodospirillaceae bacterium]|nr:SlyX protein [Rhodospirillaceae bacterium]HAA93217.1 SlyX protein [Rhodospirillaceae bacterium]HAT36396.1 SlyX protein [Rhodospirillaceae bacterium]|tara:strand:+ start:93 stop:314 length:222 start_codon:yes stop_codon:yes gene_type:complete